MTDKFATGIKIAGEMMGEDVVAALDLPGETLEAFLEEILIVRDMQIHRRSSPASIC
jgi:hypothetical protein